MRRSVLLIAFALFAGAAVLLLARPHGDEPGGAERATVRPTAAPQASIVAPTTPVAARHVTVPAEAPRPAIARYLAEDHLLDLFEALRRSHIGSDLYVAKRIEQDCHGSTANAFHIVDAMHGRAIQRFDRIPPSPDMPEVRLAVTDVVPTREQVDAATELHRRCEGFVDRARDLHATDQRALETDLLQADDPVGLAETIATHRVPATPDRLTTVLASKDPIAITLLDEELTARWQRQLLQPLPGSTFAEPSPWMQLVGCDLGIDCGPTSRAALLGCVDQASACGLAVSEQLLLRVSPADRDRIAEARSRFVDAITRGDYTIWGL